ncbi:L-asparaginase [Kosakonia cowanii]|nr:L-asparaginase [Kosakonia cowanii]TNL11686.1 L-asparaginase [Kosakonia cowanii]
MAILLASLNPGSAQNPHVLRVRSGFSALSVSSLPSPITPEVR